MKLELFAIILLLALGQAAPNYQERQIYYTEADNVCRYGEGADQIDLIITVDGFPTKRVLAHTQTYCRQWVMRCADRIAPVPLFDYLDDTSELRFDEVSTQYRVGGVLAGLVQNTTLRSPALINRKKYDCAIVGNNQRLHYGGLGIEHPPPEMQISCTTIPEVQAHLQTS